MKELTDKPEVFEWIGSRFRTLLSSEEGAGRQALVEVVSEPNTGPPRHIHGKEDETFYVLSGALELWVEGVRMTKTAGEVAFVPRGTEHAFRVVSDQPARFLTLHSPGGFDRFIAEVVQHGYQVPADMAAIAQSAARFNCTFTGPPLGEEV